MEHWKRSVFVIWFAETVAIIGFNFIMPFLPYYIQTLGINDFKQISLWAGLLGTAPSITLVIAMPFWGAIADRVGRKFMLVRAILFGSIILFLMGMAKNVEQLFFLRLAQGLFTGTIISAMALISSIIPKEDSGFGFGLIHTSIFAGVFLGPVIGGITIDKIGYRNSFFISSSLLMLATIITIFFVKEQFKRNKEKEKRSFEIIKGEILPFLSFLFLVQFASTITSPIFPLFIQKLIGSERSLTSIAGIIIGVSSFVASLSSLFSQRLSGIIGYRKFLSFSLACAGIFLLFQGLAKTIVLLFIFRVMASFFGGGIRPVLYTIINKKISREDSGKVFGLTGSFSGIGSSAGPTTGGMFASVFNISAPFFLSGFIFLLTGIMNWFVLRFKKDS